MNRKATARLHVLTARNSPRAVIFRRGPSKQVCSFLWNRDSDTFEMGQWFKGRIYEERCDLSPDGKYLLYFALKNVLRPGPAGDTWTAISRAPWLKAIELYPECGTWTGGGRFVTDSQFVLTNTTDPPMIQSDEVQRVGGQDWRVTDYPELIPLHENPHPKGWVLRMGNHDPNPNLYRLINETSGAEIHCDSWEWAELTPDSVAWASGGCLYRASIEDASAIGPPRMLYDFNPLTFEAIQAPY